MYASCFVILLYVATSVVGFPVSRFLIEIDNVSSDGPFTKTTMVKEDIQTHYENLLDEVISTHSETFLLSLTHSMNSDKINSMFRPQINQLLLDDNSNGLQDKCLYRMPQLIGKYLHDTHADAYAMVAPLIENYMNTHWPSSPQKQEKITPIEIEEILLGLNHELLARMKRMMMNPLDILSNLAEQIQSCQKEKQVSLWRQSTAIQWIANHFSRKRISDRLSSCDMEDHFLMTYLVNMQQDLTMQMDTRMEDLIQMIQDDLHDDFVGFT